MTIIATDQATDYVPNFDSADIGVMSAIVNGVSSFVEKYCNRTFGVTSYDELYHGTGDVNLLLNAYPVVAIDRVLYNPINVFQIRMTDQAASRATFALSATALTLTKVSGGVTTTRTLTLATYATLADLQTAVNVYSADGWAALALGVYATFPVADFKGPQNGDCRWQGAGYLKLHAYPLPSFEINPAIGEIVSPFGFQRGYNNFRVVYTAGFASIPPEIQQATAELAALTYKGRGINNNLQSETLGQYSYTVAAERSLKNLSATAMLALNQYKNNRIVRFRV